MKAYPNFDVEKMLQQLATWYSTEEAKLEEYIPNIQSPLCAALVEERLGLPPRSFGIPLTRFDLQYENNYPLSTLSLRRPELLFVLRAVDRGQ